MTAMINIHKNIAKYDNKHITIIIDNGGNPWFLARHIALILKYRNTRDAIINNVDNDDKISFLVLKRRTRLLSLKTHPHTIFINESGLYSLIFNSKQLEAKKFKKWVTSEVLPQIRKKGYYKMNKDVIIQLKILRKKYRKLQQINIELKDKLDDSYNKKKGTIYIKKVNGIKNVFKIGRTDNIMKRKKTYNTGEIDTIFLYTRNCENPKIVEHAIKHKFRKCLYKNDKEMFYCSLKSLKKGINDIIDIIDKDPETNLLYDEDP